MFYFNTDGGCRDRARIQPNRLANFSGNAKADLSLPKQALVLALIFGRVISLVVND